MAWTWDSWEEYVDAVHPVGIRRGTFNLSRRNTQLQSARHLLEAVHGLTEAWHALMAIGFKEKGSLAPRDSTAIRQAHNSVIQAVYAGEELLVYHKRLALNEASYGFLHQHDILDHWDRYAASERIAIEIQQLIEDIRELLDGYEHLAREDERLLLDGMDLPLELEQDFRLSRNLFSVGFDEIGLFIAARGLEKVLRKIARDRKILLESAKGKTVPADGVDLHDLIETMSKVHWKVRGTPLISRQTKTLLQYVRTVRNSGAHSGQTEVEMEDFRGTASIIARSANRLWNSVAKSKARVSPTTVPRSW